MKKNNVNIIKTFIFLSIFALQVGVFIALKLVFTLSYKISFLGSFIISLITCIYCLSSSKNSHSKAVWIIFLLLFFPFAYIFYLLSDERILFFRSRKRYKAIFENSIKYNKLQKSKSQNKAVQNDCNFLYKSGDFSSYTNTKLQYFNCGESFFQDVISRLKQAKSFIFLEFFIVSDGKLLDEILSILKEKVTNGVKVRVIYDDFGSRKAFSKQTIKKMQDLGIEICPFNKMRFIFSFMINYRDHRKIIVIDGKTAYTGGCNLADEYINHKKVHGYWKDAGIRIDGSAVDTFTLTFLRQWEFVNKKAEDYSIFLGHYDDYINEYCVVPYADGPDYALPICKGVYENMISSATSRIYIMTPYFIIDDAIANLLIRKAISGVEVVIIIPENPDKPFVYGVTRSNAERLIDYGVKVYCMKDSFVHAKLLLTDNNVVVGSVNMDLRSFYQQFECAVYTDDKMVMNDILTDFNLTIEKSRVITEKNKFRNSFIYRAFVGFMQIFAPFM